MLVHAEESYDVSCGNLSRIVIVRGKDQNPSETPNYTLAHGVLFFLKPEAQADFQAFVAASRAKLSSTSIKALPPYTPISVTANGNPLRNDLLDIRAYGGTKICTFIFLESDAFATARSVCPTAPTVLIIPPSAIQNAPNE